MNGMHFDRCEIQEEACAQYTNKRWQKSTVQAQIAKKANTTPSIKSTFGGEQYFNRHLHEEWHSVRIVKNVQMDQVNTCWRRASRGNIYARAANQRLRGVMLYYVPVLTYRTAEVQL